MTRTTFVLVAVPFALTLAFSSTACSSDETPESSSSGGAQTPDGGASAADTGSPESSTPADSASPTDSGGACNDVANAGSQVAEVAGGLTKPTPQGGTLEDGTYVLTKHEIYPPSAPDENTRRRTFRFAAGKIDYVSNDGTKPEARSSGSFTVNGTSLQLTVACPQGASAAALPFTANGNTLIMFDQASQNDVYTYTKQ
ncbi:MAG TPA: hypothetical protein VM925_00015 [Labilithrix sp.]|nr:hypothetical protein [Labilithrix sp.]